MTEEKKKVKQKGRRRCTQHSAPRHKHTPKWNAVSQRINYKHSSIIYILLLYYLFPWNSWRLTKNPVLCLGVTWWGTIVTFSVYKGILYSCCIVISVTRYSLYPNVHSNQGCHLVHVTFNSRSSAIEPSFGATQRYTITIAQLGQSNIISFKGYFSPHW